MHHDDQHLERRLAHLEHQSERLLRLVHHVLRILTAAHTAITQVFATTGEINMPQTQLKSLPGTDTLTFQTFDSSTPPVDITSRCTYSVVSDGAPVSVGTITANSVGVTYASGTTNLTITTTDSGGDTIPPVVLACTIGDVTPPPPVAATTTVTASNPSTSIS